MAKIRLIETDLWQKFRKIADDLKISNNELIRNFINGIAINFTPDEKNLNLETINAIEEFQKQNKDIVDELKNELKALEDINRVLNDEKEESLDKVTAYIEKNDKRLASQKETILKKNERIKEIKAKVSSLKKENKKLFKQVKALTVVEEEEDGDSESIIHGPPT